MEDCGLCGSWIDFFGRQVRERVAKDEVRGMIEQTFKDRRIRHARESAAQYLIASTSDARPHLPHLHRHVLT